MYTFSLYSVLAAMTLETTETRRTEQTTKPFSCGFFMLKKVLKVINCHLTTTVMSVYVCFNLDGGSCKGDG